MNRLIITEIEHNQKNYCAYLVMDEYRRLLDVQLFEPQNETLLDHIYVGFVEKIVPNIQAAFSAPCAGTFPSKRTELHAIPYYSTCTERGQEPIFGPDRSNHL